jgi:hypothetical protein
MPGLQNAVAKPWERGGLLMKVIVISLAPVAVMVCLALPLSTSAVSQEAQSVVCVKRAAEAKPPPFPAGPRPRPRGEKLGGKPSVAQSEPLLKPQCPDGEVPAVREFRPKGNGLMKGNPLIAPEQRLERQGDVLERKVFRPFRDVYRPRGNRNPPPPPPGQPACDGTWQDGACYYYGSAAFTRTADGGGMTTAILKPQYVNTGGFGHSLNEIAVQGRNSGDIVELGWLVSSDQYGDSDPHIFVFHWIDAVPQCYDGCNWQQYSSTYYPGQNIGSLVGREVYNGYVFYQGNWWAWFDNQWLGYFPGSEWDGKFIKSALIQWFGEVASLNGIPPKTDMGTGTLPPSNNAAHMFTLCDVDARAWVCWYRDQQLLSRTIALDYDARRVGFGETRYGGPGE